MRALDALLRDPARCGVLLVALDESVVRQETERLVRELRERGTDLIGVIWNRVDPPRMESVAPLPAEPPVSQFLAGRRPRRRLAPRRSGAGPIRGSVSARRPDVNS